MNIHENGRRRYIGAYLVIECYRDNPIPILNITVTSVVNSAAVAAVHIHPNSFVYGLTRGLNVFVVCSMLEAGVNATPVNKIMFVGDITSIQSTTIHNNTEYVINLTDNRRYIAELPTYYLKLIRTKHDQNSGLHMRSPGAENSSPLGDLSGGYAGAGQIPSIADEYADANFYGIDGLYLPETIYYDIKDARIAAILNEIWQGQSLASYLRHMMSPLYPEKGWEPYYINMNKKKRITDHLDVYDDGLFQADTAGKYAEAAYQSIKDTHAEMSTTYGDALARLYEIGYVFNTNIFPSITGYRDKSVQLNETDEPEYAIRSALLPGELLGIVKRRKDDTSPAPDNQQKYAIHKSKSGDNLYAKNPEVYLASQGDFNYYAIVNRELNASDKPVEAQARLAEFTVLPKMYGMLPPKCNWEILREGVTINAAIAEPPITALKYTLKDGLTGVSEFTYAYPGDLEVYSYVPKEKQAVWVPVADVAPGTTVNINSEGAFGAEIEAAIARQVAPEFQDLIRAIIYVESRGNPNVKSYTDDRGIMQVNYPFWSTTGWFNFDRMNEIEYGIWAGYRVFLEGLRLAGGNVRNALYRYNKDWGYVDDKVLARYRVIRRGAAPPDVLPIVSAGPEPPPITGKTSVSGGYYQETPADYGSQYGQRRKLMPGGAPMPLENVYGKKRVSTVSSATHELEKASQYAEESDNADDLVMTRDDKFKMLKQKVKRDYYESTVSRNTGMVSIDGLAEDVVVGMPYILFCPQLVLFYYGFVQEVSHRVDNSSGQAYTQIQLSSLTTATAIQQLEKNFAGYTRTKYMGGSANALKALNRLYSATAHSVNITAEEYAMFNLSIPENVERLTNLLTTRPGHRNICTLERLQNYYYRNEKTVAKHDDVAGSVCKSRQWMSTNMLTAMKNLLEAYSRMMETQINKYVADLVPASQTENEVMAIHETDGQSELPEETA